MSPEIKVDKPDALVDEVISISVRGLDKHQKVTIRAEIIEKGLVFASTGCFVADQNGDVDVQTHASASGTYTGQYKKNHNLLVDNYNFKHYLYFVKRNCCFSRKI